MDQNVPQPIAPQQVPAVPPAEAPYVKPPPKKRNKVVIAVFIIIFLTVVLLIGGIFIFNIQNTLPSQFAYALSIQPTPTPPILLPTPIPTKDWENYAHEGWGVRFKYHPEWKMEERLYGYDSLVAFEVSYPYFVVFERTAIGDNPSESVSGQFDVSDITWYEPDPDKPADKAGDFCSIYNCDQRTYGKYYTIKDGFKYSFYYPTDMKDELQALLITFSFQ